MKNYAFIIIITLLICACNKPDTTPTSTPTAADVLTGDCKIHMFGVSINTNSNIPTFTEINEATGLGIGTSFKPDSLYFDAFEHPAIIVDSLYYIVAPYGYIGINPEPAIQYININTGARTIIPISFYIRSLCYNYSTKTFYAIQNDSFLISFKISGNVLTGISNLGTINTFRQFTSSLTINPSTGYIYAITLAGVLYTYNGATVTSITLNRSHLSGVKYNQNDGYLYGIYNYYTGTGQNSVDSIIKINPANGVITTLVKFPYAFNVDYYSTVIDQCNNVFVISTMSDFNYIHLYPSNFTLFNCATNKSVSILNTYPVYEGLAIKY